MSREAHRTHTSILRLADSLVGVSGIRRVAPHHVFVTSPRIAEDILSGDGDTVLKSTRLNCTFDNTLGTRHLFSSGHTEGGMHAQQIRRAIGDHLRSHSQEYLATVEQGAGEIVRQARVDGYIRNVYGAIHGVFVRAILSTYAPVEPTSIAGLRGDLQAISAEVGLKQLLGIRVGGQIAALMSGRKSHRFRTLDTWAKSAVALNGADVFGYADIPEEAMRENLLLLAGAGSTSPSATSAWTIYDATAHSSVMEALRTKRGRKDRSLLMDQVLRRHPIGFVLNRKAAKDFETEKKKIRKGDTIWFLRVPQTLSESERDGEGLFRMQFGSGPRSCLGKSLGIAGFATFMDVWTDSVRNWQITRMPKSPIYHPTLKPYGMDISIGS